MTAISFEANCAARLAILREPLTDIGQEIFFLDLQLLDPDGAFLGHNHYAFSRASNLPPMLASPPNNALCLVPTIWNEWRA